MFVYLRFYHSGGGFCSANPPHLATEKITASSVFSSKDINSARRKLHLACIKMECAREEVRLLGINLFHLLVCPNSENIGFTLTGLAEH